jgi:hypothetical protein
MKNYIKSFENFVHENNAPRRAYCVVWTTKKEDLGRTEDIIDHSKFFEIGEEAIAKEFYDSLLLLEDTYCASLCKVIEDTEA